MVFCAVILVARRKLIRVPIGERYSQLPIWLLILDGELSMLIRTGWTSNLQLASSIQFTPAPPRPITTPAFAVNCNRDQD